MNSTSPFANEPVMTTQKEFFHAVRRNARAGIFAGAFLAALALATSSTAQLFQQDFSSSTNVASYTNITNPNNGQWNYIGSSGAAVTFAVVSNALSFTRTSGNAGSFSRTNDFAGPPAALVCKFDLTVSGNNNSSTSVAKWLMGAGFGTANSTEANAKVHSRFSLNVSATPGQFSLRDIAAGTNSGTFTNTQSITWVINNSGGPLSYLAPNGSQETVADDAADVWAGTTKAIDDLLATSGTNALTDWKFAFDGGTATITMDNFRVDALGSGVTRPTVTYGPLLTNGVLFVRYLADANLTHTVETNTNLATTNWGKLTNLTAAANGVFELSTPAGAAPSQFFRTVYPAY